MAPAIPSPAISPFTFTPNASSSARTMMTGTMIFTASNVTDANVFFSSQNLYPSIFFELCEYDPPKNRKSYDYKTCYKVF